MSANKMNLLRFTILFNEHDTEHIKAAEILNGLPRNQKASYIAKAVLSYAGQLENGETDFEDRIVDRILNGISRLVNGNNTDVFTQTENTQKDGEHGDSVKQSIMRFRQKI